MSILQRYDLKVEEFGYLVGFVAIAATLALWGERGEPAGQAYTWVTIAALLAAAVGYLLQKKWGLIAYGLVMIAALVFFGFTFRYGFPQPDAAISLAQILLAVFLRLTPFLLSVYFLPTYRSRLAKGNRAA